MMDLKKKVIYRSNGWYNEGLRRAKRRDISGAIEALRTSLKYCNENIAARNLLGLTYYGIGEVTQALIQWIISKNMRPKDNIAVRYIEQVQRESKRLEEINQAIHRYNQCLEQCGKGGEDIAVLQLRQVVAAHPSFLKAYQLLALIYMDTGKYPMAHDTLQVALRLDRGSKQTLRYIRELSRMPKDRKKRLRGGATRSFKPVGKREISLASDALNRSGKMIREAARHFAVVNFVCGLLIGAVVVGGLLIPGAVSRQKDRAAMDARTYSERINALTAQSDALQKTLSQYRSGELTPEEADTASSYDALSQAWQQHSSGDYTDASVADALLQVNRNALGTWGQSGYDALTGQIFPKVLPALYEQGKTAYDRQDYKEAVAALTKVVQMDAGYENGSALLMLGESCLKEKDIDQAKKWLGKVVSDFASTKEAQAAQTLLGQIKDADAGKEQAQETDSDGQSGSAEADEGNTEDAKQGETP